MEYKVKNQKNEINNYILFDTGRMPQRSFAKIQGDTVTFESSLERAVFFTKMLVPGFGGAMLFADNCGEGFEPSEEAVDFIYEAARTRLFHLGKYVEEVREKYGYIPKQASERIQRAESLLEKGNPGEEESLKALSELLWAGEEIVLFDSQNKIAKEGPRRDFLIGCSTKGFTESLPVWREKFSELFNAACVPHHWGVVEPAREDPHYEVLDEMIDWLKQEKIVIRGHALVWFSPNWECNSWIGDLEYEEAKRLVLERVDRLTKQHKDDYDIIDFNEPMQANALNMTFDEHFTIVKEAYAIARKNAPNCKIMLNFF